MSKSQSEFLSKKKLCRALHSENLQNYFHTFHYLSSPYIPIVVTTVNAKNREFS